ncbi:precursor of CEP3-like [Quercus robur]|uniref:precursor of CEP3-like n=1 Tax=Quercus lobata TaxID=97700 RepID=UPI00124432FF|nr:precursor of CEP3-like [Quercus lobata]XP_050240975.1 precursor of CEP3-like [Quercus robur]
MAQSKLISAFLFLVFILSQQIQSIEGRHLREGKKSNESQTLQTQTKIYETESIIHGDVLHGDDKSNEEITSESTPTPPTVRESQLPPPPNRGVDDFRPTAPGHSPGAGHSIQN